VDKAKAVLKQALSLDPEHPRANYNMAVMFEAKGNIRAALHCVGEKYSSDLGV
jgi:Tfp pilus assembly protein PilF